MLKVEKMDKRSTDKSDAAARKDHGLEAHATIWQALQSLYDAGHRSIRIEAGEQVARLEIREHGARRTEHKVVTWSLRLAPVVMVALTLVVLLIVLLGDASDDRETREAIRDAAAAVSEQTVKTPEPEAAAEEVVDSLEEPLDKSDG